MSCKSRITVGRNNGMTEPMIGSIDWQQPAEVIVGDLMSGNGAVMSFYRGTKFVLKAAESGPAVGAPPGTVVSEFPNGFVVSAGVGSVNVTHYELSIHPGRTLSLLEILGLYQASLPIPLSRSPFADNTDVTEWEPAVRREGARDRSAWRDRPTAGRP